MPQRLGIAKEEPLGIVEEQDLPLDPNDPNFRVDVPIQPELPSAGGFGRNAVSSTGRMMRDTATGLGGIAKVALEGHPPVDMKDPNARLTGPLDQMAEGVLNRIKLYASDIDPGAALEQLKQGRVGAAIGNILPVHAIYNDPAGAAADVAGVVGGAQAASRMARTGSRMAGPRGVDRVRLDQNSRRILNPPEPQGAWSPETANPEGWRSTATGGGAITDSAGNPIRRGGVGFGQPTLRKGAPPQSMESQIAGAMQDEMAAGPAKSTLPPEPGITPSGREGDFYSSGRPGVSAGRYDEMTAPPKDPAVVKQDALLNAIEDQLKDPDAPKVAPSVEPPPAEYNAMRNSPYGEGQVMPGPRPSEMADEVADVPTGGGVNFREDVVPPAVPDRPDLVPVGDEARYNAVQPPLPRGVTDDDVFRMISEKLDMGRRLPDDAPVVGPGPIDDLPPVSGGGPDVRGPRNIEGRVDDINSRIDELEADDYGANEAAGFKEATGLEAIRSVLKNEDLAGRQGPITGRDTRFYTAPGDVPGGTSAAVQATRTGDNMHLDWAGSVEPGMGRELIDRAINDALEGGAHRMTGEAKWGSGPYYEKNFGAKMGSEDPLTGSVPFEAPISYTERLRSAVEPDNPMNAKTFESGFEPGTPEARSASGLHRTDSEMRARIQHLLDDEKGSMLAGLPSYLVQRAIERAISKQLGLSGVAKEGPGRIRRAGSSVNRRGGDLLTEAVAGRFMEQKDK